MKKIYKYVFNSKLFDEKKLHLPKYSTPVHFEIDDVYLTIWVQISSYQETEDMFFRVVGTGWEYEDEWFHAMTLRQGPYIWHLLYRDSDES
jgi:hypothetical protein